MLSPVQQLVHDVFKDAGLDPALGLAIGQWESGGTWDPGLVNSSGGDGARGGSYGIMQMSLKTALQLDKNATPEQLLRTRYNAQLAAQLVKQNWARAHGVTKDVISMYNCGKPFRAAPKATKSVYVPHVTRYLKAWRKALVHHVPT